MAEEDSMFEWERPELAVCKLVEILMVTSNEVPVAEDN